MQIYRKVITIAYRLSKPFTSVASLENFWPKASDKLCAGSVEISKTDSRTLESCTAKEHEVVVLPTNT